MSERTTAEALIDLLADGGVDTVSGLPDDDILEAWPWGQDAGRRARVRHEEAAARAAVGSAKGDRAEAPARTSR